MTEQTLDGAWLLRERGAADWIPGHVPGGVHLDLLAAGRISDPFAGDEELRVQWVAERDWEYRREFAVDEAVAGQRARRARLRRPRHAGRDPPQRRAARQRRQHVPDLALGRDRPAAARLNELSVIFRSAVGRAAELEAVRHLDSPDSQLPGAPYLRKAPCHFGWDWGPRLPNIGFWQGVRLEGWSVARLADVRLSQAIEGDGARISAEVRMERAEIARASDRRASPIEARLRVEHPNGQTTSVTSGIDPAQYGGHPCGRHRRAGAVVAERPGRAAALPGRGPAGRRFDRRSTRSRSRSASARSSCAGSRTPGASRSASSSTACRSSPRAATGSRPTRSQRASTPDRLEALLRRGRGREPQHDPGLGRRLLRGRGLLRPVRPVRHPRLAGLHVRLQRLSARRPGVPGKRPRRGLRAGAAAAPSGLPGAVVRQQRDGARLDGLGLGSTRDAGSQGGVPALLRRDAAGVGRGRGRGHCLLAELAFVGQAARGGDRRAERRRARMGRLARARALLGVRPGVVPIRERVRLRVAAGGGDGRRLRAGPGRLEPGLAGHGPPPAVPGRATRGSSTTWPSSSGCRATSADSST